MEHTSPKLLICRLATNHNRNNQSIGYMVVYDHAGCGYIDDKKVPGGRPQLSRSFAWPCLRFDNLALLSVAGSVDPDKGTFLIASHPPVATWPADPESFYRG